MTPVVAGLQKKKITKKKKKVDMIIHFRIRCKRRERLEPIIRPIYVSFLEPVCAWRFVGEKLPDAGWCQAPVSGQMASNLDVYVYSG
jgi:hypothetical protein